MKCYECRKEIPDNRTVCEECEKKQKEREPERNSRLRHCSDAI